VDDSQNVLGFVNVHEKEQSILSRGVRLHHCLGNLTIIIYSHESKHVDFDTCEMKKIVY
jgi:hypothetical protein